MKPLGRSHQVDVALLPVNSTFDPCQKSSCMQMISGHRLSSMQDVTTRKLDVRNAHVKAQLSMCLGSVDGI